ncbi:MAG: putative signal transducing protein [Syntrophales bacterium]
MQETDEARWEAIATASGMMQANIIRGRLESQGIATQLRYEAAGSIYAITIDGLGEVRILVPSSDRERAKELLSRSYDDGDLPWEKESLDPNGQDGG